MHTGVTRGPDTVRAMLRLQERGDGAVSADGRVAGCYLHGLFASDSYRHAVLRSLGGGAGRLAHFEHQVETALDGLADHLAAHLDLDGILTAAGYS